MPVHIITELKFPASLVRCGVPLFIWLLLGVLASVAYGNTHTDIGLSRPNGKEIDKVPSGQASKPSLLGLTSARSEIYFLDF